MLKPLNLFRSFAIVVSFITVSYAANALVAAPEAAGQCCNSTEDCSGGQVCCLPESVGEAQDCDSSAPNYCRIVCLPNG